MPIADGGILMNEEWRNGDDERLGEIALKTVRYRDRKFQTRL
jgi:hypothetical protein